MRLAVSKQAHWRSRRRSRPFRGASGIGSGFGRYAHGLAAPHRHSIRVAASGRRLLYDRQRMRQSGCVHPDKSSLVLVQRRQSDNYCRRHIRRYADAADGNQHYRIGRPHWHCGDESPRSSLEHRDRILHRRSHSSSLSAVHCRCRAVRWTGGRSWSVSTLRRRRPARRRLLSTARRSKSTVSSTCSPI